MGTKRRKAEQAGVDAIRNGDADPTPQEVAEQREQPGALPSADELFQGPGVMRERQGRTFVNLKEPGETFVGVFLRRTKPDGESKYPGLIFAEYPSGEVRVMTANWGVLDHIAKFEERGVNLQQHVAQVTVTEVVAKKNGEAVKLYDFSVVPAPSSFKVPNVDHLEL